jgi:NAD(P)H-quinone oxidoreductase subunit 5
MDSVDTLYQYAWLIPVLPLFGAAVVGIGLISYGEATSKLRQPASIFIVSLIGVAMVLSFAIFWSQWQGHPPYTAMFEWASAGDFSIQMGYTIDHLAALMLVVVTTVAFLVMIYTDGYMAHDPGYVRFYAYLSLFSSSTLGLFWATGSFEFEAMGDRLTDLVNVGSLAPSIAAIFAVLVFLGPVAKSAQFPLHVWLPDAMEGPTPISALIHAATMVAAGVFLVARMYPVFEHIPTVMTVIAYTGAFTAFMGATIAITQNDIKKGLAFSTMSQLGYMVMAMGVGAYSAGLFHLMTHAYFKAMLFLGSGSVIHGMEAVVGHDPVLAQDMRLMGGLRKYMPVTAITFLIGTLAICGIPPFAGFWSKDEILGATFAANPALWAVGWLTAGITAFYMFRMYFSTFEGSFRGNDEGIRRDLKRAQLQKMGMSLGPGAMNPQELTLDAPDDDHDDHGHHAHEPHESPLSMTFPLMALAVPSVLVGLLGTPFANYFEAFIHPPGEVFEAAEAAEAFDWSEFVLMAGSSVAIATVGIIISVLMYRTKAIDPKAIAAKIPFLYNLSLNKWYIDDIYEVVFVQGSRKLAKQVLEIDIRIVDGLVNLAGLVTLVTGEGLKYLENGRAQFYALIVFGAVLGLVLLSGVT